MMKSILSILAFGLSVIAFSQDVIERDYFPNARAKNASIAAARYAEEGYHYTKFIQYISAVDSSRMFADTALFFVKRSMMLGDTALYYASESNLGARNYLNIARAKTHTADTIIREFYPMVDIKSHHVFGSDAALNLSNAVMDYFNASLLLRSEDDVPAAEEERYEVLPFDDEIVRLEADEATFQLAANEYEKEVKELSRMSEEIVNDLQLADNEKSRKDLENIQEEVSAQLTYSTERLKDTSTRIQEIRQLLDTKYLEDVKDVEEPDHLAQFETESDSDEIEVDETVPDGLVYKVQLGYYPVDVNIENFHGLFPISGETVRSDLLRCYAGLFYTYSDASKGNDYVQNNAIPNAFVVAFNNGEKISISQAIEVERRRGLK